MKIKVKDLDRLENYNAIISKLCELDSKTFLVIIRACVKIRQANKILARSVERK